MGHDFTLILTEKMETRHPVDGSCGSEFPSMCYHCAVIAKPGNFEKCLRFLEKRPLTVKFLKFYTESIYRDTDRRCCV